MQVLLEIGAGVIPANRHDIGQIKSQSEREGTKGKGRGCKEGKDFGGGGGRKRKHHCHPSTTIPITIVRSPRAMSRARFVVLSP